MFFKIIFNLGLESHFFLNFNKKIFNFLNFLKFKKFFNNRISYFETGLGGVLPIFNYNFSKNLMFFGFYLKNYLFYISFFVRKNYFYPDIPKNYQITQNLSILNIGLILIYNNYCNFPYYKFIRIFKIHFEEDASKISYLYKYSQMDFNRSNYYLLEIVSFYNINNFYESYIYLNNLKNFIFFYKKKYLKNFLRFDLNISCKYLYYDFLLFKIEIKNLDSFFILKNVIAFEIKRQIFNLYFFKIINETRFYNLKDNFTYFVRNKEGFNSYKYFLEPEKTFLYFEKKFFLKFLNLNILLFYYIKNFSIFNFKSFFFLNFFTFNLLNFFFKYNKNKVLLFSKIFFYLIKNVSLNKLLIIFKLYLINNFSFSFLKKFFIISVKKNIYFLLLIIIKNNLIKQFNIFIILNHLLINNIKTFHSIFINKKILNFFLHYFFKLNSKSKFIINKLNLKIKFLMF